MGFFSSDEEIAARAEIKPKVPSIAKRKLAEVTAGATGCDACALKQTWPTLGSPRMPISGNTKDADILILGEAPGEQEDREGKAFVGESGQLLRKVIPGRHMHRIAFQNVARCRPPNNATPTPQIAHACSIHLDEDIAKLPIKHVIGVGGVPLSRVFPGQSITYIHGLRMPARFGDKVVWYYPVLHPSYVLRLGGDRSYVWPIFKSDFRRFFENFETWQKPEIANISKSDVILPECEDDANTLLDAMQEPLAVDVETTGLSSLERDARLLTAAVSDGSYTIAFAVDHPNHPNPWGLRVLERAIRKRRWLAHNAAMELRWFLHYFPEVPEEEISNFDDTMAIARLVHEREGASGLDIVSRLTIGVNVKALSDLDVRSLIKYPLADVLIYNGLDALGTRLAYDKMHKRPNKANYQRLLGSVAALTRTEMMGLPINLVTAQNLHEKWTAKQRSAAERAKKIYEVRQFEAATLRTFNIASNDDIGEALVVHGKVNLPSGAPRGNRKTWKTDEKILKEAAPDNPLVSAVLDHREASKLISTYIDPVIEAPKRFVDGLIHPKYTVLKIATGRTSSEDPNAQNFPKHDIEQMEVRRQVEARKGHLLVAFDYGQIEARIIACASRDRSYIQKLLDGYDVHAHWRGQALQVYPDWMNVVAERTNEFEEKRLLKAARDLIKNRFVFQHFFGGSVKGASESTGIPLVYMEQLSEEFWRDFRGVKSWIKQRRAEYNEKGTSCTLTGRVRYGVLPGNEPINNPIQGTAADVFLDAINEISALSVKLRDPYLQPRIAIHDDLVFELPDDDRLDEYIDTIQKIMVKVRYPWQFVPFIAEARIGQNWCDLEEFAVFTGGFVR